MATMRDVGRIALRKCGVLRHGASPKDWQARDAQEALQSVYQELIERGVFGELTEVIATENMTAEEQTRITAGAYTITMPTTVTDTSGTTDDYGETQTSDPRPPRDLSLVVVVTAGEEPQIHLYDRNRAEWMRLDGLVVNSVAARLSEEAPLSNRSVDGLASLVAKKLAEDYGQPVSAETQASAGRFYAMLTGANPGLNISRKYY
jgi:hypothetical protein